MSVKTHFHRLSSGRNISRILEKTENCTCPEKREHNFCKNTIDPLGFYQFSENILGD